MHGIDTAQATVYMDTITFDTVHISMLHVLTLIFYTLIFTNILIAVIGDVVEEVTETGEAWRRFVKAKFVVDYCEAGGRIDSKAHECPTGHALLVVRALQQSSGERDDGSDAHSPPRRRSFERRRASSIASDAPCVGSVSFANSLSSFTRNDRGVMVSPHHGRGAFDGRVAGMETQNRTTGYG